LFRSMDNPAKSISRPYIAVNHPLCIRIRSVKKERTRGFRCDLNKQFNAVFPSQFPFAAHSHAHNICRDDKIAVWEILLFVAKVLSAGCVPHIQTEGGNKKIYLSEATSPCMIT
jgi:hypothetical protein